MTERFIYVYEGHNPRTKLPIWSCKREGAGFVGYGVTDREALQAFLDLEQELVPTHQERQTEAAIDDFLHEEAFPDERGEQA